jgi:hypothetical protein
LCFAITGFLKKLPALPMIEGSGSLLLRILITACEMALIDRSCTPIFPVPVYCTILVWKTGFLFSLKLTFRITNWPGIFLENTFAVAKPAIHRV